MITSPFTPEQLNQVLIVGNASGEWQPLKRGLSFIFNGTEALSYVEAESFNASYSKSAIINISNGGYAKSDAAFVVQSNQLTQSQSEWLTTQLNATAHMLKHRLNCWPSSGLTCFALLSQLAPVQVSRMSLLPSLSRDLQMSQDEHLPCIVHNWLGERRIALEIMKKANGVHWPELLLTETPAITEGNALVEDVLTEGALVDGVLAEGAFVDDSSVIKPITASVLVSKVKPSQYCAFDLLHQLATSAPLNTRHYHKALAQIEVLSQLNSQQWQSLLNPIQLQQALMDVEALFVDQSLQQHPLMRPDNIGLQPRYWYLADNSASQYLDAIRLQLALCQQNLCDSPQL